MKKAYMCPRPPRILLRNDWTEELGSKVDRQPEGEMSVNSFHEELSSPNRTGRLVVTRNSNMFI